MSEAIIVAIVTGIFSAICVSIPLFIQNRKDRKRDKDVYVESIRCLLRNAMLSIYDKCIEKKEISRYQLQSFTYMYEQYKLIGGNSFIDDINTQIHEFKLVD